MNYMFMVESVGGCSNRVIFVCHQCGYRSASSVSNNQREWYSEDSRRRFENVYAA